MLRTNFFATSAAGRCPSQNLLIINLPSLLYAICTSPFSPLNFRWLLPLISSIGAYHGCKFINIRLRASNLDIVQEYF